MATPTKTPAAKLMSQDIDDWRDVCFALHGLQKREGGGPNWARAVTEKLVSEQSWNATFN